MCVSIDNALTHLGDLEAIVQCARAVRAALRRDGRFVFDINTRRQLRGRSGVTVTEMPRAFIMWRSVVRPDASASYSTVLGFVRGDDGRYARFEQFLHCARRRAKRSGRSS